MGSSSSPLRVTILSKTLLHYRAAFFDGLRARLAGDGIELDLVVGQPTTPEAASKADAIELPWTIAGRSRSVGWAGRELVWQPGLDRARRSSLVVVEQASKLLVNYPLLAGHAFGHGPPVAFWGHGANLQAHRASPLGERVKRFISTRAHWWFGYTEATARIVAGLGFPRARITVVNNASDTAALRAARRAVTPEERRAVRARLRLPDDAAVGLFVGSLYHDKRLPFLLDAAVELHARRPAFHLVVAGDGPQRSLLEAAARRLPFVRFVGPARDEDLARLGAIARVGLLPGLVGLGVLDLFALGLPVAATAYPYHSPEIDYLTSGGGGVVTGSWRRATAYADDIDRLLGDPRRHRCLADEADRLARTVTVEAMVDRFAEGVRAALAATAPATAA